MKKDMIGRTGLILFLLGCFWVLSHESATKILAFIPSLLISFGGVIYILFGERCDT